ncbi:MAG TPA: DUF134 domain-containing protein [Clostridia bacterium]|jgi:predicted DNA-binding protein (UPF0251 family)|nr:DUF134 domain-containing protein [Clostridia bacterium]
MSRPKKWRKVCGLPEVNRYGPLNGYVNDFIIMPIDEYETVRLIDFEGFTQEECAENMNIARTTVQAIYQDARKKIADSLVNGKALIIEGGEYKLCDGRGGQCGGMGCRRHQYGKNTIEEDK